MGSSGSEPGFLRVGMTAAIFKLDGTTPEARDALMMFTIGWQRMGRQAFTRVVGIRSSLLVEDLAEVTSFFTWSASSGEKVERQHW